MKRERAQLSVKNPCHIPKHRYYELKHFCLQYPDWKKGTGFTGRLEHRTAWYSGHH